MIPEARKNPKLLGSSATLPSSKDTDLWRQREAKRDVAVLVGGLGCSLCPSGGIAACTRSRAAPDGPNVLAARRRGRQPGSAALPDPTEIQRPPAASEGLCSATDPHRPSQAVLQSCQPWGIRFILFSPDKMQIQKGSLGSKAPKSSLGICCKSSPDYLEKWKSELSSSVLGFSIKRCQIDLSPTTMKKKNQHTFNIFLKKVKPGKDFRECPKLLTF